MPNAGDLDAFSEKGPVTKELDVPRTVTRKASRSIASYCIQSTYDDGCYRCIARIGALSSLMMPRCSNPTSSSLLPSSLTRDIASSLRFHPEWQQPGRLCNIQNPKSLYYQRFIKDNPKTDFDSKAYTRMKEKRRNKRR